MLSARQRACRYATVAGASAALFALAVPAQAKSVPSSAVVVRFIPESPGATLLRLDAGRRGAGELIYYLANRGPSRPSLLVILHNEGRQAVADVYQALPHHHWVNLRNLGPTPSLVITALGGWWERHGLPNYNLDVAIFGPVYGMWGATEAYLRQVGWDEPLYSIEVRQDAQGIPSWEARWLLPTFPGQTFIDFSYSQRECSGPLTRLSSPSPLWPYVTGGGGFLQANGTLHPPIVVNWPTGRIRYFSEIVTARGQACSYDYYDENPVTSRHPNDVSFETPWGFYNVSGHPSAYPNLIVHTFFNPPGQPSGLTPQLTARYGYVPPAPPLSDIRYSWADHPGNLLLDFKVDLFGPYGYHHVTRIADGTLAMVAPGYHQFPQWVLAKPWPVAAFVQAGPGYASSEGIYQWSTAAVGYPYALGLTGQPNLSVFSSLPAGLRGEYRVGVARPVWIYKSPIDGRLHLLFAQHGLWQLSDGNQLREANLTGGPYLDQWTYLVRVPSRVTVSELMHRLPDIEQALQVLAPTYRPVDRLTVLPGGYVLIVTPDGVTWMRDGPPLAAGPWVQPPRNHATWVQFVKAARPAMTGKPASDLAAWITPVNPLDEIHAAHVDARILAVGRKTFTLELIVPLAAGALRLPGVNRSLTPGRWVLEEQAGRLVAEPAAPPRFRVRVTSVRASQWGRSWIDMRIRNQGTLPWRGVVSLWTRRRLVARSLVTVGGRGRWVGSLDFVPRVTGSVPVRLNIGDRTLVRFHLFISPWQRPSVGRLLLLSDPSTWADPLELLLGGSLLLVAVLAWTWRKVFLWR
jgi:hypothetical protein